MAPPAQGNKASNKAAASSGGLQLGPITPATQVVVVAVVAILLLVGYYFMFFQPAEEEMTKEVRRKRELEDQLGRANRALREYLTDVGELERSRTHAAELQRILPDTADIPGFLRHINTLGEASGLEITRIEPVEEKPDQYYVRVPVRIEVTGSYFALARFFRAISQLPRVINMENITLNEPELVNGEVRLKARALATTFRSTTAAENSRAAEDRARPAAGAPAAGGRR